MKDPGALAQPSAKNVKNVMEMNKLFHVEKRLLIVSKTCQKLLANCAQKQNRA